LIDSGAKSNFISKLLVKKAALVDPNSCTIMVYGIHDIYICIADDERKMVKQTDSFFAVDL
jgi:hypothetical protein